MRFSKKQRRTPQINIVPMIDVVLQLLLFFMLTTTFKFTVEGMRVDLPKTGSRQGANSLESVVVLNREGDIFFSDRRVSLGELREEAASLAARRPDGVVVIKADKDVRHGRVVQVMDTLNGAGIRKMAIATETSR